MLYQLHQLYQLYDVYERYELYDLYARYERCEQQCGWLWPPSRSEAPALVLRAVVLLLG